MDRYFYSQKENGFFTDLNKAPSDVVEITTDEWLLLLDGQDNGMKIVSNQEGYPVLTEQPPLSKENLIALADLKKRKLINEANEHMNSRQWPGKAANFRNLFMYSPNGKKDGLQIIPLSEVAAKDEFLNIKNVSRDDMMAAHRVPPQIFHFPNYSHLKFYFSLKVCKETLSFYDTLGKHNRPRTRMFYPRPMHCKP